MDIRNYYTSALALMTTASLMLTTACSEDLLDGNGTTNQVQVASATVGSSISTRMAVEQTSFADGDEIMIATNEAGTDMQTYKFATSTGWTANTPLKWGSSYPVTFYACYPAGASYNAFTLPTNQSGTGTGGSSIEAANYMTAKTDALTEKPVNGSIDLTFAHRTAQVRICITGRAIGNNNGDLSAASIFSPKATISATATDAATSITPRQTTETINNVANTTCYTALVAPGNASGFKIFSVKVGNETTPRTFTTDINLEANHIYTYHVTIGTDRIALTDLTVADWTETTATGTMLGKWEEYASTSLTGTGTAADPYLIASAADLAYIVKKVNKNEGAYKTSYYKLTQNIDLSGKLWTPIAYVTSATGLSFGGTFDGNGKTISGLTIRQDADFTEFGKGYACGLFGFISKATICKLNLTKVDIQGDYKSGGLAGSAYESLIYGCTVDGTVHGSGKVGGLIGEVNSTMNLFACGTRCTVTATSAGSYAGGFIGSSSMATNTIKSCYAAGTTSGVTGSNVRTFINSIVPPICQGCASVEAGETGMTKGVAAGVAMADLKSEIDKGGSIIFNKKKYEATDVEWIDKTATAVTDGSCPWLFPGDYMPTDFDMLLIGSAEELLQLATDVNNGVYTSAAKVLLTANIDMAGLDWVPIGNSTQKFLGTFDGGGYTISNISLSSSSYSGMGLFGYVNHGSTIKNVTLRDVSFVNTASYTSTPYSGSLAGQAGNTGDGGKIIIDNCHVTGNSTVKAVLRSGGLVGLGRDVTMTRCSSSANVSATGGTGFAGGLAGDLGGSKIYACCASGNITASGYEAAGLVGYAIAITDPVTSICTPFSISACYFSGTLTTKGASTGGRLISDAYKDVTLSYCAATDINAQPLIKNPGTGNKIYMQCNNTNENTTAGVEVSAFYGILANSANTLTFTGGDGNTYNVKDCWQDNGSALPTLKVKADGTTE